MIALSDSARIKLRQTVREEQICGLAALLILNDLTWSKPLVQKHNAPIGAALVDYRFGRELADKSSYLLHRLGK